MEIHFGTTINHLPGGGVNGKKPNGGRQKKYLKQSIYNKNYSKFYQFCPLGMYKS